MAATPLPRRRSLSRTTRSAAVQRLHEGKGLRVRSVQLPKIAARPRGEQGGIQLRLHNAGGDTVGVVWAQPSQSVRTMKEAIEAATEIPVLDQRLYVGPKELWDVKPVSEYFPFDNGEVMVLSRHLEGEEATWFKAVEERPWKLQQAPERIRADLASDLNLTLAAVKQSGAALRLASPELRAAKDVVLFAVDEHGEALEWAAPELRDDHEVVLHAVKQRGSALKWASERLQGNREVVCAALGKDAEALAFAGPNLRDDENVVFLAVGKSDSAFGFASARLREDGDFVLKSVKARASNFQWASPRLRSDPKFVEVAVRSQSDVMQWLSERQLMERVWKRVEW